jgi:hypothetical protein
VLVVEVEEDADEVEEVEEQVVVGEEVVDLHAELVVRGGRLIHEYAICVFLYLSKLLKCLFGQKKAKVFTPLAISNGNHGILRPKNVAGWLVTSDLSFYPEYFCILSLPI